MTADPRTELGIVRDRRQAVVAEGPEAASFLQGQLSQDIDALAPGDSAWSLVLHPQGKISAWFRIARTEHERFVLDVDHGWADEIVQRLTRFKLRTKVEIVAQPWESITIVGPGADDVDVTAAFGSVEHDMVDNWVGVPVRDVFGSSLDLAALGLPEMDPAAVEALRIEGGIPRMGVELDDSTIPAASGIVDRSVSFTKGCYTGQELVARIDSRGNNVPQRLLGIVFDGPGLPASGADVRSTGGDSGDSVGTITSAAPSKRFGGGVALAYIRRTAEVGQTVEVDTAGGPITGELRALPIAGS